MYNVGLLSLFLYNVLTSAKGVYLGSFLQKVHPFLVLAICFTLVTLFFAVYNYLVPVNGVSARKVAKAQWKQVVYLNISGLAGWTGFYYALKLIEPVVLRLSGVAGQPRVHLAKEQHAAVRRDASAVEPRDHLAPVRVQERVDQQDRGDQDRRDPHRGDGRPE